MNTLSLTYVLFASRRPLYIERLRYCHFTSFPLSVIESKRKYTEAAAILEGKNVQWVVVGDNISCCLSVLVILARASY